LPPTGPSALELACAAVLELPVAKLSAGRVELRVFHGSHPWGDQPCPLWIAQTLLGTVVNVQFPLLESIQAALLERSPGIPVLAEGGQERLLTAMGRLTPVASIWENVTLCVDEQHFLPWHEHPAVPLDPHHQRLRQVRTQEPVSDSAVEISFGVLRAGQVVSYADVQRRNDAVASLGVWTDPEFRNRGMGRSVVSAATRHLLASGRVAIYITARDNLASLSLCQALGYQKFGEDLYCFRPK